MLYRLTGARQVAAVPEPLPNTLVVDGVGYARAFRPGSYPAPTAERRYVEVLKAPPLVRPCVHGCPGCGRVESCGEDPYGIGIGRTRRCSECDP